jgi:ABC-type transporter Mla subunit MlaD
MLLEASAEAEKRVLTILGTAFVLCLTGIGGLLNVFHPFSGRPDSAISVVIDTPYVGPGVGKGTAMVMHGVKVGQVTAIYSLPEGGVRLDAELQKKPAAGLTDSVNFDFRPINYFGVTGINLIGGMGGRPLRNGARLAVVPHGNFALETLLSRLGKLSTGAVTK